MMEAMQEAIEQRFRLNLDRVQALIALYGSVGGGASRRPVQRADILRAGVVFLHAALEDLVRSALEWKLPTSAPEHLASVPLVGFEKGSTKFSMADLAKHRGLSVDQVVVKSVEASLEHSNFGDPGDLELALTRIGVDPTATLDPWKNRLGPMMARRHWIVHRADRHDPSRQGQHGARSLSAATVQVWRDAVEGFGSAFLAAL